MALTLSSIDFGILRLCSENRETPANLSAHLDIAPNYASSELSKLREHNYIERPGPAENSGMNVTTETGEFALSKRETYEHEYAEVFNTLVRGTFKYANEFGIEVNDVLCYSDETVRITRDVQTITVENVVESLDNDLNRMQNATTHLYELWFYDLIENAPWKVDENELSERGHTVAAADADTARELHEELYG